MPDAKKTVDTNHPEYEAMKPQWETARATVAGGRAVKALGTRFLPALKDQEKDDYNAYKMRASYFNATWRTISALAGMIFRKDPVVTVPDAITPMLEDVTGSGVDLHIFAQQVTVEDLTTGRIGILVDHPVESTEGLTQAAAENMNIRPVMNFYTAETVYNWKEGRVNNQTVPVEIRLLEDFALPAEGFENPEIEKRYRVLDLFERTPEEGMIYRVRVYRIDKKGEDDQIGKDIFPLMNGKPLTFIPFYMIGLDDTTLDMDEPPMIDLMDVNLDHYRLSADLKHGMHFGGIPTGIITGYTPEKDGDKLYVGGSEFIVLPNPEAKAFFLEYGGQGLKPISEEMQADEDRMAILGARLLASERKSTETAQAARIYRVGESSILAALAATISIGMTKALTTFCEWAGATGECSIELNQEFMPPEVSPEELKEWLVAWQVGAPGFSDQGFFDLLKDREMVAEDVTLEDEQARIGESGPTAPDTEGDDE